MSNFLLFAFLLCFPIVEAQKRECGLPKNLNELPDFAKEEIQEIWKNHTPGTSCQKELEIERDILDVIDSFNTENRSEGSSKSATSAAIKNHETDYDHAHNGASKEHVPASKLLPEKSTSENTKFTDVDDYIDQTTFDDVAMMQFDNMKAPFLRTASPYVREEFRKVWEDSDIPSESLRSFKIQLLAVSLLSSKQLTEYNRWSTKRRRVLKAREQEMRSLSDAAKSTLRKLSVQKDEQHMFVPIEIKNELTAFVHKLNRRRNLKLIR